MSKMRCAASVLHADLLHLEDDFKALEAAGCSELHFDIMDGQFAPDFALSSHFVAAAKRACSLPCIVHLMVSQPEAHIQRLVDAGSDGIVVHTEASNHIQGLLARIRKAGVFPGIAINPATSLTRIDYLLDYVDRVLVMAVEPGCPKQHLIPNTFERVRILRENIVYRKLGVKLEVKGDLNPLNTARLIKAGAEIVVLDHSNLFDGTHDVGVGSKFRAFVDAVQML